MGLLKYISVKVITMLITLMCVSFIIYGIIELMPGDYAERELFRKFSGTGVAITQSDIEETRKQLGLDRPFMVRYFEWISNILLRFDFGSSFRMETSVNNIIKEKFLYTFFIIIMATIFSYVIALPVGVWTAIKKSGFSNTIVTIISYMGLAIPNFALALILLIINANIFDANIVGLISPEFQDKPLSIGKVLDFLSHAYIPIFVLGWASTAFQLQTMHVLMQEELEAPYVLAARARGLPERRMLLRYPVRHATIPMISTIGFDLSRAFNELPIVASILVLGELGQELLLAFLDADQNVVGAILLIITTMIVVVNLLSDLLIAAIDPRIKLQQ